jgi:ElaB/YqjD/DUF883 family membrane-anchored ribosome-binding protein
MAFRLHEDNPMPDQQNPRSPASSGTGSSSIASTPDKKELTTLVGEAGSKLTEMAQEAGTKAKEAASSLALQAGENAKTLMNKQVGTSADFVGHVAKSLRVAAEDLDDHAPQLAKWAKGVAARADEFSASIRYQTVDELYANASEYARRKPALVFSVAAACGFLLFRLFKAAPGALQPQQQGGQSGGAYSNSRRSSDGY